MLKDKALTITLNPEPALDEEPMNARDKTNSLIILTPEGIEFSLQLAGPITRCMAWWIDMVSISVLASLVNTILVFIGLFSGYLAYAIAILSYFVISIGYGIFFEWYWQGQTLGKKFLRLRVMDEQECVRSDVALSCFVRAALRGLTASVTSPGPTNRSSS